MEIRPESKAISKVEWFAWEHGRTSRLHAKSGFKNGWTQTKESESFRSVHLPGQALRKEMYIVVSVTREIEVKEKGEGSLSISIVPLESWEISPTESQ